MQQGGQCRRRFLFGASAVCAGLAVGGRDAWSMMAPIHYTRARAEAAHHVQFEISAREGGRVTGRVVRVFRGPLRKGARLTLHLSVRDPSAPVIVGGTVWTDPQALAGARYLEAFLDGDPPDIVMNQVKIIEAPTEAPVGDWRAEGFLW
jgi:hypothetical protein